jgi:hypothetical protein
VKWNDEDFYAIESAVYSGLSPFTTVGEKEYYYPEELVTRDMLASTLYLMSDFEKMDKIHNINDLGNCSVPRIVQKIVDHNILTLDEDGNFNPKQIVTEQEVIDAMKLVLKTK